MAQILAEDSIRHESSAEAILDQLSSIPIPTPPTKEELDCFLSSHESELPSALKEQIHNLARFRANGPVKPYPTKKLASVLILLHPSRTPNPPSTSTSRTSSTRKPELKVTLTTRSKHLRSHPGDTALPGGRYDLTDKSLVHTALREAWEEIGLPLDLSLPNSSSSSSSSLSSVTGCQEKGKRKAGRRGSMKYLTTLPAFTSATMLVVVPIVYLLLDDRENSILSSLVPNPGEVDEIFHASLDRFLGLDPIEEGRESEKYGYSYEDLPWVKEALYRLHSFSHSSFKSNVTGLTADILISTALIAKYGLHEVGEEREDGLDGRLGFERRAEGQLMWKEILEVAVNTEGKFGARRSGTKKE